MFGTVLGTVLLLACGGGPDGAAAGRETGEPDSGRPTTAALQLALPLTEPERFTTVVGVDHDPVDHGDDGALGRLQCTDYLGRAFPDCYDEHDGSDYILSGGFSAMDAGSSPVVAALSGTVVLARDGYYDRCHGDLATGDVTCDGHEIVANAVTLEHAGADGRTWRTLYWHLAKDSVAVVEGQEVSAGQTLGLVGSSGYSSLPHLHFEVQVQGSDAGGDTGDGDWVTVDPYAGPYSQSESYWCAQGDEDDLPGPC